MTFTVFVDENSHYEDKSERYKNGDYETFEEALGDFGRICRALERDYGLSNLTIDIFSLRTVPTSLRDGNWLVPGAIVVWEDRASSALEWPEGFREIDRRTWGDTQVAFGRFEAV